MTPEEIQFPWDYQMIEGHDLVQIFKAAWHAADDAGAEGERTHSGLLAVLRALAWEMDELRLPADQDDKRTMLIQHVLHRAGDQGSGQ